MFSGNNNMGNLHTQQNQPSIFKFFYSEFKCYSVRNRQTVGQNIYIIYALIEQPSIKYQLLKSRFPPSGFSQTDEHFELQSSFVTNNISIRKVQRGDILNSQYTRNINMSLA